MSSEREALRALLALVRRDAPHLSGKVVGDAEAALASAPAAEPTEEQLLAAYAQATGGAPFDSDFHRGLFLRHARIALAHTPASHPQAQNSPKSSPC